MRRLLLSAGLSIVLLGILVCLLLTPPIEDYSVVVNYDQSLEEMIAAGNYDYVNPDITSENFPALAGANGQVAVELELVRFNQRMSSEQALAELDNLGFHPATLPELLAFGAQYPDLQRQYTIIALGSVWFWDSGSRFVPYLDKHNDGRELGVVFFGFEWDESFRFLAVRKSR